MSGRPHCTVAYVTGRASKGFQNSLIRDSQGWEDTDALFAPGVLEFYPEIPQHSRAELYGVAYEDLVACDSLGRQIAYWDGEKRRWVDTP